MNIRLIFWDNDNLGTELYYCTVNSYPSYQEGQILYLTLNDSPDGPIPYLIKKIEHHIQEKRIHQKMEIRHRMDISISSKTF